MLRDSAFLNCHGMYFALPAAACWHCVRYVMAITKKRFSLPNWQKEPRIPD